MLFHLKYLLLTLILLTVVACNSSKKPKKEEVKENNTTSINSNLGVLSGKQKVAKKELDAYLKDLSNFNTDSIVDKTYPKLFHVIDLDLFRQYIASMMNSTDIEMQSYETNITQLSKVTSFSNGTEFAQAQYTSKIQIHFLNTDIYNTDEKINFLYDALIHKYGKDNIHINTQERILEIKKEEKLLIIKEKDTEWKFLSDNSNYRKLYPSFLPQEIFKIINIEETKIRKDTNETI